MQQEKRTVALSILALGCFASSVFACNVPVFRYALERWPADPFGVIVFHRGKLSSESQKVLKVLEDKSLDNEGVGNYVVRVVDLNGQVSPEMKKLWEAEKQDKLPWMVVRYPLRWGVQKNAWSSPLTMQQIGALLDSPLRREVADRILKGDSAVWILLESGNRKKDEAAATLLKERLGKMREILDMPELTPEDQQYLTDSEGGPPLRVAFSLLRLSRNDAKEGAVVNMLLDTEDDLRTFSDPIVFPIFGRGRVLYALVGDGINEENMAQTCAFLVGPCSCQAKAMNPGVDLLMCVDWDAGLFGEWVKDEPVVPLTSLPAAESKPKKEPLHEQVPATVPQRQAAGVPLLHNAVIVLVVGLGVLVAGTLFILRRRDSS